MPAFYVVGSDDIYNKPLAVFILFFIKLSIHKVDSLFLAKIGVFRRPTNGLIFILLYKPASRGQNCQPLRNNRLRTTDYVQQNTTKHF
jgi:hypothetical protein